MAESVVSTQTNYPDQPDTSLAAYNRAMGNRGFGASGLSRWFKSTFGDDPTYNQWRSEQWDQYNSKLNAYNAYISSLVGQKAMSQEAGYNPAWLGSDAGGGTASPLEYQNAQDPGQNPFQEIIQGVGTFMQLASGAQAIYKQALQNKLLGQEINNAALDNVIKGATARYAERYQGYKAFKMGFQSDMAKLLYGNELNSRLAGSSFDGTSWMEYTAPGLTNQYEISPDVRKGFSYQTQFNEVEILKATKQWRIYQGEIARWSGQERKYYNQEIQPILKEWYEGRKTYQDTVNALYEAQKRNEMGNRTAGTVTRVILGLLNLASRFFLGTSIVDVDAATGEILGERKSTPIIGG